MNVSDLILSVIARMDIDRIFGVPGGAVEKLFDAINRAQARGEIKHVLPRHEAASAFMAHGYYLNKRRMGVCVSTSGPGATNLITGVATAMQENIPMLVITAQTALSKFGRHALQDSSDVGVDIVQMFKSCTKYSSLVSHPDQVVEKLLAAIEAATTWPMGPVHLSFPSDVLASPHDEVNLIDMIQSRPQLSPSEASYAMLHTALTTAKRPIILIGDNSSEYATTSILAFAEQTKIPVVVTCGGSGWYPWNDNFKGVFGFGGHESAGAMIDESDLVLAINLRTTEFNTNGWCDTIKNANIIELGECSLFSAFSKYRVRGNLNEIFGWLKMHFTNNMANDSIQFSTALPASPNIRKVHPAHLMSMLACHLPKNSAVFVDAGNSWSWAMHYLRLSDRVSRIHTCFNFGAMAWSIGAAIGFAANRTQPTVSICGDGSWLMSSLELSTAIAEKLPVVFVIVNDSSLGMVKHGQKMGKAENIANQLPATNFAAMAEAAGVESYIITSLEQLGGIDFDYFNQINHPIVLDVRIDETMVPPIRSRIEGLKLPVTPGQ